MTRKRLRFLTLLVLSTLSSAAVTPASQTELPSRLEAASHSSPLPIDADAKGLEQMLRKLRTRASIMTIVAHPDDEDGGMLTLEARGHGARVGIMTLTRGEGGQNIMSADSGDALGLLRTEELLAADRYYNADQYFGTEADFGFSKTLEEAMQQWTHDRVLRDVVRAVRTYRPLVLTSTFIGALTDGHGHHQVSGEMAQEAFLAAGDPNVFPEQIREGLLPWQPLKVYARLPFFSITEKGMYDYATQKWAPVRFHDYVSNTDINGTPAANVVEHEGVMDPALGATYVQVAFQGLMQQRSQIPGTISAPSGVHDVEYHRFGSKVAAIDKEQSFFDGIDVTLRGIADLEPEEHSFLRRDLENLQHLVDRTQKEFDAAALRKSAPGLAEGLTVVNALIEKVHASQLSDAEKSAVVYELHIKQQQFNDALALALALRLDAVATSAGSFVVPGQTLTVEITTSSDAAAKFDKIDMRSSSGANWLRSPETHPATLPASPGATYTQLHMQAPQDASPIVPYFTRTSISQPYYDLAVPAYAGMPRTPYPLTAHANFSYNGVTVSLDRVVQTVAKTTTSASEPLVVAPPVDVVVAPPIRYEALPGRPFTITAHLHNNVAGAVGGTIKFAAYDGMQVAPSQAPFAIMDGGAHQDVAFEAQLAGLTEKTYQIPASGRSEGKAFDSSFRAVGYPGLRTSYESKRAIIRVVGVNARVAPNLKIGYVAGTGDNVPSALENLGAIVHLLTDDELKNTDLAHYDAILLGIRTYGAREVLKQVNSRLLDYVKQGGTVIVQYNSGQYDHNYGPFEYSLTSDPARVVEEKAEVTILNPGAPLFAWPNQITTRDFDHWVEERGHSFMRSWDSHYSALTETHDAGQEPQRGGLLVADYGKGVYVYVAYALYRQLDEGVPGAYRLLANLISLKQNPNRTR